MARGVSLYRRGRNYDGRRAAAALALAVILFLAILVPLFDIMPAVDAPAPPNDAALAPSHFWGPFFGTSGDVQVDVNRKGIAVRVEIPREFLYGVITNENDTHFIVSDIRNDYYYYSVVDESTHWSYNRKGTDSDAPCFKPSFTIHDPNAPWCVEIWNFLNGTFLNFSPPKFIRFIRLNAPRIAGVYNFTLFVADHTNALGLPDFVHAWNKTFFVPVSMSDNPASIYGSICDDDNSTHTCPTIFDKGVVYARNVNTGQIARAYVNETTGKFNVTGLAPGDYEMRGSAGVFNRVAFSFSPPLTVLNLNRGNSLNIDKLHLKRAPQVCGTIEYDRSQTLAPLAHSLTDHPYLKRAGINSLNITVEATDGQGHVFRYQNVSLDGATDNFKILTGVGEKYVGSDPYGTEFAGLPSVDAGSYSMNVNVWITGYVHRVSETVTVASAPGETPPFLCNQVTPPPVQMLTGGAIFGAVQLYDLQPGGSLQTPHEAEVALGLTPTDALFGGNILVQAYDHRGLRRGVVVVNGTRRDGKTIFANSSVVNFMVIGFSEFYNRTLSGTWAVKDYGLPDDQGYQLTVLIRGYEQTATPALTIASGDSRNITIRMVRGGAISVGAFSYDNLPGKRVIQAKLPFRFLAFGIPVRARIYFYNSASVIIGYVERLVRLGVPNGVQGSDFFQVIFAGQNWNLREITFFGFQPTHLTNDTYSVKGYTLGYVQQKPVSTPMDLGGFEHVSLVLLLGNEIDTTVPVFAEPSLLGSIPEHDHVIGEAFAGSLAGAVNGNLTAGIPTLHLPIFGFGGMVQNTTLTGQGHFFYVSHDGTPYFDYGLDVGTYSTQVPEFGFNRHFIPLTTLSATFGDLFLEQGPVLDVFAMARVFSSESVVQGWVAKPTGVFVMPLSWVKVAATNGTITVNVPTLDGSYNPPGALNLPAGTYNITFSVAFYKPQTIQNVQVQWDGDYPVLPPANLCPIADPSVC
jgi:hypothetical protein